MTDLLVRLACGLIAGASTPTTRDLLDDERGKGAAGEVIVLDALPAGGSTSAGWNRHGDRASLTATSVAASRGPIV
jgi:hypothetical protein